MATLVVECISILRDIGEGRIADIFAELLRELEAKNRRLEAAEKLLQQTQDDCAQALKRANQTEAQAAVMREALVEISDTDPDSGTQWFHDRANAALSADAGSKALAVIEAAREWASYVRTIPAEPLKLERPLLDAIDELDGRK